MNLIFEEKPVQAYLDAYLYQTIEDLGDGACKIWKQDIWKITPTA